MIRKVLPPTIAFIMIAFVSFGLIISNSSANPHTDAATCMATGDPLCDGLCSYCHATSTPDDEFYSEIHRNGDVPICQPCHNNETVLGNANLLSHKSGGNHPSQIEFDPFAVRGSQNPVSSVLFCGNAGRDNTAAPWTCKVLCSTCHDSHGDAPGLLRMSNQGSALCFDCHNY